MKTATSAGGIIVCHPDSSWYVLILKDMNDTWTFPKGMIEKGELVEEAAIREIKEEVGITNLKNLFPLTPIAYRYKRGRIIQKEVQYFVFLSQRLTKPKIQKEEGIREAQWVPYEKAIGIIGYRQTNVTLLEETWKSLQHRT